MEFLPWHYSAGLNQYLKRWYFLLAWVIHYFSLPILLPTLFSPWKRLLDEENLPGFSFERFFRSVSFNIVSRCIGAVVRLVLLLVGLLVLFPCFLAGLIGLVFWIICPLIGIPSFMASDRHHARFFGNMYSKTLHDSPAAQMTVLFSSVPGKFILSRTGLSLNDLLANLDPKAGISDPSLPPQDLVSYLQIFISAKLWPEPALKQLGVDYADLIIAAQWWDEINHTHPEPDEDKLRLSRPGLGLELLFGYTPQLNKYAVDLSAPQHFSHHLIGREDLVSQLERTLISGSSLVLVGEPGIGKKTIILELARRAMAGELDAALIYKRFMELDYNFLLSDSLDVNQKKSHLSQILSESSGAGNVILVIKDLHRLTHPDVEGLDFTDLLEQHLDSRQLKIIAISSQVDYERFILPNARLRKYFQVVEAKPVTKEVALNILFEYLFSQEKFHKVFFTVQAVRRVLDGSDEYLSDTPFPEKCLELADHVITYAQQSSLPSINVEDVNRVLTEITGISVTRLTGSQKQTLSNVEDLLHQGLVGQDSAVKLIAKSLRSRDLGVKNSNRPIGSFLFLGPTGVGKTQTAKTLAKIYFGSEKSLIRFDMAEYAGPDGFTRLLGSTEHNRPGQLPAAIRKNPASLLLLDEVEKAPPQIYNLFLTLLDEGEFTDAYGKKVSCRHLFVIATSNAGAEFVRQLVNKRVSGEPLQKRVVDEVQKSGIFSPEFINRFDGVVVYEPLSAAQLAQIASMLLSDLAARIKSQNIYLEITDAACIKIAELGFQPEYGARPMRRLVDLEIGDIVATALLRHQLDSGDTFRLVPQDSSPFFSLQKV